MHGSFRQMYPSQHPPTRVNSATSESKTLPPIKIPSVSSKSERRSTRKTDEGENTPRSPKEVLSYYRSMLATSTRKGIKTMRGRLLSRLPIYKEKHITSGEGVDIKQVGVVLDLIEQGFNESAEYLIKMLDFEIQFRSTPENVADSNQWPWLHKSESLLNVLVSSLREAELARRNRKRLLEVATWFHISVFIALRRNCWHWLADLLFKQCLKVTKILKTGVKREASIRFTYAQFLSEKLNLQIEALRQYNIVRRLTQTGHYEGLDLLHVNEFNCDLHSQSCYFMYKVCLQIVKKIRDKNPSLAVKLSQKADEFIEVACNNATVAPPGNIDRNSAIFELVLSLMASHEYTTAISKLNSIQTMCREKFDPKGFCKALYLRARCLQLMNKNGLAIADLRVLCEIAMKCGFGDMSVLAELEYAELLLTLGSKNPLETLRNAAFSFLTSHNDADRDVRQRARCVIGIAEGLYLWPFYKDMIVASQTSRVQLNKLIEWKFCRAPFMPNQIQAFALQIPKRQSQQSQAFVQQIQKFVLPEKLYQVLGERLRSVHVFQADSMEN